MLESTPVKNNLAYDERAQMFNPSHLQLDFTPASIENKNACGLLSPLACQNKSTLF